MSSAPKSVPQVKPKIESKTGVSMVTKLVPFICAGAAVGVSILALKELKKIKNEMLLVKNKQSTVPTNVVKPDPEMVKKMDRFEIEFKKINEYLMNNNPKNPKIIKNVLKPEPVKGINKIINEPEVVVKPVVEQESDVEYEEVEVTDDEEEEN